MESYKVNRLPSGVGADRASVLLLEPGFELQTLDGKCINMGVNSPKAEPYQQTEILFKPGPHVITFKPTKAAEIGECVLVHTFASGRRYRVILKTRGRVGTVSLDQLQEDGMWRTVKEKIPFDKKSTIWVASFLRSIEKL